MKSMKLRPSVALTAAVVAVAMNPNSQHAYNSQFCDRVNRAHHGNARTVVTRNYLSKLSGLIATSSKRSLMLFIRSATPAVRYSTVRPCMVAPKPW